MQDSKEAPGTSGLPDSVAIIPAGLERCQAIGGLAGKSGNLSRNNWRQSFLQEGLFMRDDICYHPIGVIHSSFLRVEDIPSPPHPGSSVPAQVEIFPEYAPGLQDVEGFSHLILLYHLDRARDPRLIVVPPRDTVAHGVFATRAPARPNPIGLAVVRLVRRDGSTLFVESLDALDGTPVLDIKPYLPEFEEPPVLRLGWLEAASVAKKAKG
jgi:tRNA (adenine37-N6)-methyltransferase